MAELGIATVHVTTEWDDGALAGLAAAMDQAAPVRIGRTVHYRSRGSADDKFPPTCVAAIVTALGKGSDVGLAVLNPSGLFFHGFAEYERGALGSGTWHRQSDCPFDPDKILPF
jgi:hypothetical protein